MARIRTHPGDVLREEFMKPVGVSANALALRVPATRIGDILRTEKQRAVTANHGPATERDVRPRKELVA
jgi:plasmid maintenance system antidote protein VapI